MGGHRVAVRGRRGSGSGSEIVRIARSKPFVAVAVLAVVGACAVAAVAVGTSALRPDRTADVAQVARSPQPGSKGPVTVPVGSSSGGSSASGATAGAPAASPPHPLSTSPSTAPSTSSTSGAPAGHASSSGTRAPAAHLSSASAPAPSRPAAAPDGQACTNPVWRSSAPDAMWRDGKYFIHTNMWNAGSYHVSQSTQACSYHSWNVTATADNANGDGAVKASPNVHVDYHDWNTGTEPAWSSIKTLTSTFAASDPHVGIYNVAYDIWMNGVPGNREIMIWTSNYHQQPSGRVVASGVAVSGTTWDVWATGDNGYLAFVPRQPLASGTLDLKAMINLLVAQGRVPASSTLGQVCFGVEIVSTDGSPATFRFTDFSVTSS